MITIRNSIVLSLTQHIHEITIPNVRSSTLETVPQIFINDKFALCELVFTDRSVRRLFSLTHIRTHFKHPRDIFQIY